MKKVEIVLRPIGYVRNNFNSKEKMDYDEDISKIIVYDEYAEGLSKIEDEEYLTIIFYFHLSGEEKLVTVRRDGKETGVFASRSPNRPNHLGIATGKLLKREGNILTVKGIDCLNETPVLDIKPKSRKFDGVDQ